MNKQLGITLIELMVVMVIVAILAAIAVPSYSNHVKKTRRNMAAGCVQEYAQFMERWYTSKMTYEDAPVHSCQPELADFYTVEVTDVAARTFTIEATPKGAQEDDKCGTLSVDEKGRRSQSKGTLETCWK